MSDFQNAPICSKCGCMICDPFGDNQKIHDEKNCRGIVPVATSVQPATSMDDVIAAKDWRIAELEKQLEESAFNCPSCGRHDFGLWHGSSEMASRIEELTRMVDVLCVALKKYGLTIAGCSWREYAENKAKEGAL